MSSSKKIIRSPIFSNFKQNVSSKLILLRHGESIYQQRLKEVVKEYHQLKSSNPNEFTRLVNKVRFNPDLCDPVLSEQGKTESYEAGEKLEMLNIKYVFVSPLMRALQSCDLLLKGYIDAIKKSGRSIKSPKVMVNPLLFEKIEDSCEIVPNIYRNMNSFKNFDWKEFKKLRQESLPIYMLHYCDTVLDKTSNTAQVSNDNPYFKLCFNLFKKNLEYTHKDVILKAMEELSPVFIESSFKTYDRLLEFKTFLKNFTKENSMKNDDKILLVGHNALFKHLFSNMIYQENFQPVETEDNFLKLDYAQTASLFFEDEALFSNLKT